MSRIRRRDVLKGLGVAGSGVLAGCLDPDLRTVDPVPDGWDRGEERWIMSTCGQCQAACGIRVRSYEGRAVKIEGSPDHPVNRGGIGPKGQAGLQLLYHPDRVEGPLKRVGPRGEGRFEPIGWDEAIRQIASKLKDMRGHSGSRSLVVIDGEPRGLMRQLWTRFLDAYGSPNHVTHESTGFGGKILAMATMHGVTDLPAYDWQNAGYVIGFGTSIFESWCQAIHLTRSSGQMKRGKSGHRSKFVQVSPQFSPTSAKADEWIPVEPGTYGALALGLAHVLVRNELYDKDFVSEHTFGFEDWTDSQGKSHRGFQDLVEKEYPTERVASITGLPAATVERLAREMAGNRPAIAFSDEGAAAATNGLGTAMAIHALNALLGSLERPGGLLVQKPAPLSPWKPVEQDVPARLGCAAPRIDGAGTPVHPLARSAVQRLPEAILGDGLYPVEVLLLYRSNPIFSKPEGGRWIQALEKVPLVVSFSPLRDESVLWADLVLPDRTYLEQWDVIEPVPSMGFPVLGLRQPAVTPLHDTVATGDVLIRLARDLGPPISSAFPWADYRAAISERLEGLARSKGGSIEETDVTKFIDALARAGVWSAPPYAFEQWEGAFPTPSGKFEFYSQEIARRLQEAFPAGADEALARMGVATRGDDLCLPHWEPPRFEGDPATYPFLVIPYRGIDHAEGGSRHIPWLTELPGNGWNAWQIRIDIGPKDAKSLGVSTGDRVLVESPAGRLVLSVRVIPGVRPGTVGLAVGQGRWPPAPGREGTPAVMSLLASLSDPLAGILALQGTRVRITKDGA